MSSILKALKKLEDENNARTPDSLKIDAEILRGGDSPRISTTGIILAALLLFLGGGGATYLFMKPGGKKPASISPPASVERALPAAGAAAAAPRSPQVTPIDTSLPAPAAGPQPAEKPKQSTSTAATAALKPVRNRSLPQLNAAQRVLAPATTLPPEQPDIPIVSARPVVRVNGIAFQDGSDSVAVINGLPVSRGALVEGVKVEEIQRDRVLFSYGGEKFEVSLGKSNQ